MDQETTKPAIDRNDQHEGKGSFFKSKLPLVIGAISIGFLFLDLVAPIAFVFGSSFVIVFMMNIVVGQLTLLCVWGTLVEGTFWIRLPWTMLMLVVSWAALASGVNVAQGSNTAEVLGLGLVWFYAFAISYIPLKLAAWIFGWRILNEDKKDSLKLKSNYQIRDMMIGTAILAVALSIGRMLVPGELPSWTNMLNESGLDGGPLTALFIFSMVSLVVKLPCIWVALAVPLSRVKLYSIWWIGIAAIIGLVEMGILILFLGSAGPETPEFIAGLMIGHAAMAAIMIGVLYLLRSFGYRMTRRKRLPT